MKFKDWFINFDFKGRSRRSHYWANYGAWVGAFLALMLLTALVTAILAATKGGGGAVSQVAAAVFGLVLGALWIAAIVGGTVDNLAMLFRRAHDTNRTGWILLLLLVPFVNFFALYWLLIQDSDAGPNKYGPPQKTFYAPAAAE